MGFRLILFLLVAGLIYFLLRRWIDRLGVDSTPGVDAKPEQEMLQCQHCGTHIPADEAITREGRIYCCREHADASSTDNPDDQNHRPE